MVPVIDFLSRMRLLSNPPQATKHENALRFGILGAARIGPDALLTPALSHPDVVVVAVASRDDAKAKKYAKTHKITKVYSGKDCYKNLIADESIDVVYNALPNSLHYEWTKCALEAGKHVLCEKPITVVSAEAKELTKLAAQKKLVLFEAIHWFFHPSAQRVKHLVDSGDFGEMKSIRAEFALPSLASGLFFFKDDIRYNYNLGGGVTMDMGVYPLSALRFFTSSDPLEVTQATPTGHSSDPERVDRAMHTIYSFPDSVLGETFVDFAMPGWGPFGLFPRALKFGVYITLEGGEVSLTNFALPHLWHKITVTPKQRKARIEKVYKPMEGPGEEWWSSYRYQLEAFVDKVRGREPAFWPSFNEPITQLEWVERIYTKAGLPTRPGSTTKPV